MSPLGTKWMFVPHIIRPDYERVTAFTEHGWDLMPAEPRISGKVVFVTGPGAISYAESVMGIVEGYRLGAIVGAPTAGANGNIICSSVPGGFSIVFTGMKVTRLTDASIISSACSPPIRCAALSRASAPAATRNSRPRSVSCVPTDTALDLDGHDAVRRALTFGQR